MRDVVILVIVEIYRYVGEKVRMDFYKRGIFFVRLEMIFVKFDEV